MQPETNPEIDLRNEMAVNRLTPYQRRLLSLHAEGYAWADISEQLKITKEQARAEYKRLVKHLPTVAVQVAKLRVAGVTV